MRVALVHDYLNQYGGGERVLEVLMEIFPEAPIYTLLHDEKKTHGRFAGRVKNTSMLDFQFARDNHRLFIPLMPLAVRTMILDDDYDLIISDSAGYAKGVLHRHGHSYCHGNCGRVKHISYIHTPLRYAWETENYFENKIFTGLFYPIFDYLKSWDYRAGQKPDLLIANSSFIAGKIKNYYGREARVIYPPVDTEKFLYRPIRANKPDEYSYYLAVGRMLHYKRFDLIIDAFAKLGKSQIANGKSFNLKIVGSGPEEESIKYQASSIKAGNVEILPFATDEELRKLYSGAKALIFPQVEDFGLVAAEAQACGAPIIAYAAGGALEIVEDGKTGLFFKEQTSESLADAVKRFEILSSGGESAFGGKFDRRSIASKAKRFSKENFKKEFLTFVGTLM